MEKKIINTLRSLSVDMIEKSNSGHPGMPLGCAPMMFILWCKIMNFNPENPLMFNRDRFVLSNGHGCALLYSMLYLLGYSYTLEDLQSFRKIHSITPGHPEYNPFLGIEISTGPLGQGIANGVGMAIASKKLGLDNFIYVMCGDGCLMEGISYESCSLAGHLCLNNLVLLYDDNGITIDGKTEITFTEDVKMRFQSFNWNVLIVEDGDNDLETIYNNLILAKQCDKPSIIFVKTTIGYGSLNAGKSSVHGAPLGKNNTELLKEYLGIDKTKSFFVDEDVKDFFIQLKKEKREWNNKVENNNNNSNNSNLNLVLDELKKIKNGDKEYASRDSSNIVLKKIVELMDNVLIGSADLAESNKTMVSHDIFSKDNYSGKYIHYGIREHAMVAIGNGITTLGILPIISTFLVFITYCLGAIRMSALSRHKIIYVFTHDSIFLGEDGPSHQPIESLTILRSIPNLLTLRPCDVTEVSGAYQIALEYEGPSAIILSRQVLPNYNITCMEKMKKGAYKVFEISETPDLIIVATGSEVALAVEIAKSMDISITVVSMPCSNLFDKQSKEYKELILPKNIKKMSLEAGATVGWYKYVDFTYGIDTFGESGKISDLKQHFGFTVEKIKTFIQLL